MICNLEVIGSIPVGGSNLFVMKNKRLHFLCVYDGTLISYRKKQIRTRVKKHFMSDSEFLGIYNLYTNIRNIDDYHFVINMIKTSKTYRHYKCNSLYVRTYHEKGIVLSDAIKRLEAHKRIVPYDRMLLKAVMEWLFSHTIHTTSLNSVTFR